MSWGPQTNPRGTALTGRQSTLPGAGELATMLREGHTLDEIARAHSCAAGTIVHRLHGGGYSTITGEPLTRPEGDDPPPPPLVIPGTWVEDALCAQTDPESFYPEKGGSTAEAKRICRSCVVQAECLDYALEAGEKFGIWGGVSERERRKLTKPQPSATSTQEVA